MTPWIPRIAMLCTILCAATAQAGLHTPRSVVIDDKSMTASGSPGTAHNSSSRYESIGCSAEQLGDGDENKLVQCTAYDAGGNFAFCNGWGDPRIFDLAMHIDSGSFVQFEWDANRNCSRLLVRKSSNTEPKRTLPPQDSLPTSELPDR